METLNIYLFHIIFVVVNIDSSNAIFASNTLRQLVSYCSHADDGDNEEEEVQEQEEQEYHLHYTQLTDFFITHLPTHASTHSLTY